MPTYEYECDACGDDFEEFQYFSEPPLTRCPECKKSTLRRLVGTGATIICKGSGFYEPDYRSESHKSGAKAEQDATKPAENGEAKADAKPDKASAGSAKGTKGKGGAAGKSDKPAA